MITATIDETLDKKIKQTVAGIVLGFATSMASIPATTYFNSNNPYREEPAVVRYQTAEIARSVFEQQKTALKYSSKYLDNWRYENKELTPLFNEVFSDNDKRLSSLDSAIRIVDDDLAGLNETPEVKAYHNWGVANKIGFVIFYLGGIALALGSVGYLIRLENEKERSVREQSRLKNPEQQAF